MKIFYLILFFQALALSSASGETLVIRVGYDKGGMPINDHYVKKTVTFQTSEDLFAKIRATDFQKALFYLGFNPEFSRRLTITGWKPTIATISTKFLSTRTC